MDDRGTLAAPPAPAHRGTGPVQLTCRGAGSPPLTVLARVQHVFCDAAAGAVWPVLRRELRAGVVAAGDLVLLRIGRGPEETWLELAVTG